MDFSKRLDLPKVWADPVRPTLVQSNIVHHRSHPADAPCYARQSDRHHHTSPTVASSCVQRHPTPLYHAHARQDVPHPAPPAPARLCATRAHRRGQAISSTPNHSCRALAQGQRHTDNATCRAGTAQPRLHILMHSAHRMHWRSICKASACRHPPQSFLQRQPLCAACTQRRRARRS